MKRTEIINLLIEKRGYKSYLEIGVYDPSVNFDKIKCEEKTGVDPRPTRADIVGLTSDEFFAQNSKTFDIVFIDGLHEAAQVEKDIANSLKYLNEDGVIVMHDCNPTTEEMQRVPRMQGEWTGDVWKAFVKFRESCGLYMFVVDTDYGCGIIERGTQHPLSVINPTYKSFAKHRKDWLNLISVDDFKRMISK